MQDVQIDEVIPTMNPGVASLILVSSRSKGPVHINRGGYLATSSTILGSSASSSEKAHGVIIAMMTHDSRSTVAHLKIPHLGCLIPTPTKQMCIVGASRIGSIVVPYS